MYFLSHCISSAGLLCSCAAQFSISFESSKRLLSERSARRWDLAKAARRRAEHYTCMCICRLMRGRIKVADPRIHLVSAAYIHIREEVVDEY